MLAKMIDHSLLHPTVTDKDILAGGAAGPSRTSAPTT
jgi:hypothetical protein